MCLFICISLFAALVFFSPFALSGMISRDEEERELMDIITKELS